jgi:N-acyl-D-amino-acid deacylase
VKPGYHADITIFDPNKIVDTATYQDPINYPDGISYVFVNGVKTIEHKKNLHANGGSVIKAERSLFSCCNHPHTAKIPTAD